MAEDENTNVEESAVVEKTPEVPKKKKIVIQEEKFTFGDMVDFEDATGLAFMDAFRQEFVLDENGRKVPDPENKGRPMLRATVSSMRALVGMIWLVMRVDDPSLTMQDMLKLKLSEFDLELEVEADPKDDQTVSESESSEDTDSKS